MFYLWSQCHYSLSPQAKFDFVCFDTIEIPTLDKIWSEKVFISGGIASHLTSLSYKVELGSIQVLRCYELILDL